MATLELYNPDRNGQLAFRLQTENWQRQKLNSGHRHEEAHSNTNSTTDPQLHLVKDSRGDTTTQVRYIVTVIPLSLCTKNFNVMIMSLCTINVTYNYVFVVGYMCIVYVSQIYVLCCIERAGCNYC